MDERTLQQQVLQSTVKEICQKAEERKHCSICVICLDIISEKAIAQPCKHESFDFLCLLSWLEQRQTCPLCKAAITSVRYNYRSAKDFQTYLVPAPRKEPNSTPATNTGIEAHAARNFQERIWRRAPRPRLQRPPSTPDAAISKRKEVYRNKSYSLHVGTNRLSRFQDLSPQLFRRDEELVSRARKWIRRELQVFDFLSADADVEEGTRRKANNAEFLLEYIIAILKSVDIKGSGGQAYDMLQEFLGPENSKLFLHELQAWLRSPYTQLDDWDRHVQYGRTAFTTLPEHYLPLTTRKETYAISDSGSTIASPLKRKNPPGMYDFYRPDRDMSSLATKRRTFKRYISD